MSEITNITGQADAPAVEQDNVMQHIQGMIEDLLKNAVDKIQKADIGDKLGDTPSDQADGDDSIPQVDITELKGFIGVMQKFIDNVKVIVAQLEGSTESGSTDDAFIEGYMATADNILEIAAFSMKDNLTGLSNRYGFDNRLILEWNRATRDKSALGLVIFSVDGSTECKDNKKHDDLIKTISETLKNTIKRSTDFFARWSDNEFAALLPITDITGATIVTERIRMKIGNIDFSNILNENVKCTVSIGVYVHVPEPGEQPADFINKTYNAFIRSKETDGNTIIFA